MIGGSLFANPDLNRLAVHSALQHLAWALISAFSAVFLLRQGLSPAEIFLCFGATIVLRFAMRPAVLVSVRAIGLRSTLIVGTALYAIQSPLLAPIHGFDTALLIFCVASALAQAFYWTTYHAMFAAVGEADNRGSQVGWRQLLIAIAGTAGPALGGVALTVAGPWAAFGAAALVECLAIVPLPGLIEPKIAPTAPSGAFAFYKRGVVLFASDGWIFNCSAWAWNLIMFQALNDSYDAFGGSLAALALAGALSGLVLGRFIDKGHARRAIWLNAVTLAGSLIAKSVCGLGAIPVLTVAFATTALGGLYTPSFMTAIYNDAKASPCPFRFHFAAEVGWDIGGALACLVAAALCADGVSLQMLIVLALPVVAFQAFVLEDSYAAGKGALAVMSTELPGR
jgi:DHA1 family inner membrane transport protein